MHSNQNVPSRLDPGTPIDVGPTRFWVWVQSVKLYKDPTKGGAPLNSVRDLYPIINCHYKPKPGVKTPPNPSTYLFEMGKIGLMRRFGEPGADNFWAPETDVVVRVSKRIVYTPADLDALLAGDERFRVPTGQIDDCATVPVPSQVHAETSLFERVHEELWNLGEPTDVEDERLLDRSTALSKVEHLTGSKTGYIQLFRWKRLHRGSNKDVAVVVRPTALLGTSTAVSEPPATPKSNASLFQDCETVKLRELEDSKLEEFQTYLETVITQAQSHLAGLIAERERRTQLHVLKEQERELARKREELEVAQRDLVERMKALGIE
jgi:hypothetical protein